MAVDFFTKGQFGSAGDTDLPGQQQRFALFAAIPVFVF